MNRRVSLGRRYGISLVQEIRQARWNQMIEDVASSSTATGGVRGVIAKI